MTPHVLLALLLLDGPAPIADETVQTLDLGMLTFRDARQLEGQAVRISFVVDSLPDDIDGDVLVDAEGGPGVSPCVRFAASVQADKLEPEKRLTIEGRIRTRIVPGRIIGGERFEPVFEVEVMDAREVRP